MTLVDENNQRLPVTNINVVAVIRENHAEIKATHTFKNEKEGKTGILSVVRPEGSVPGLILYNNAEGKPVKIHGKFSHRDETEHAENSNHYDIPDLEGDITLKEIPLSASNDITFSFITKVGFAADNLESKTFTFTIPKDVYQIVNSSGADVPNNVKINVRAHKGIENVQITSDHAGDVTHDEKTGTAVFKNAKGDEDIAISFDKVNLTPTTVVFSMDPIKKDFQYVYVAHNPTLSYLTEMKNTDPNVEFVPYFVEFDKEDYEKSMIFYYAIERSDAMIAQLRDIKDFFKIWLEMLPPDTRFNVIGFGDRIEALYPVSQELNDENKEDAIKKVSEFTCDLQNCNFTNFLENVKSEIIDSGDDDFIYSPNRIFVISSGDITSETAVEKLGEITGDRDVRVYYVSLKKPISQEVINGFIKEGGGFAQNVFDMTELRGVVSLMIDHCYQPNYKALEIIPNEPHKEDFNNFIDKKLTLSKIGNLRDQIEFITRIKAEMGQKCGFRIQYDAYDKNSVSEDIDVVIAESHNELLRAIYNYNKFLEDEKMDKSSKVVADNCGSAAITSENGVSMMSLSINLDGAPVKPKKFPTETQVDDMKKDISNYLGIPLANLEFSIKGKPLDLTGTLAANAQEFEERIDITTIGEKKPIPPDEQVINAMNKNSLWEVSPGLLAAMKKTPEQWEKILAEGKKKLAANFKGVDDAEAETALFSMAILSFYKVAFPKEQAKFATYSNNAVRAITKIVKGYNPGIQNTVSALIK